MWEMHVPLRLLGCFRRAGGCPRSCAYAVTPGWSTYAGRARRVPLAAGWRLPIVPGGRQHGCWTPRTSSSAARSPLAVSCGALTWFSLLPGGGTVVGSGSGSGSGRVVRAGVPVDDGDPGVGLAERRRGQQAAMLAPITTAWPRRPSTLVDEATDGNPVSCAAWSRPA